MKKELKGFLCGVLATSLCAGAVAFAANYEAVTAGFKVLVNGKEFTSDPPALVVEGRTYLPLRAIGDALGVPVNWNDELGQAEVGNSEEINKAVNIDGNATVDGFNFSQLSVQKQEYSEMYQCRVEVENDTGKDIGSMMFTISFFDADGTRVGVANAGVITNGMKNGETKTASLFSTDDLSRAKTARYEVSVVTNAQ